MEFSFHCFFFLVSYVPGGMNNALLGEWRRKLGVLKDCKPTLRLLPAGSKPHWLSPGICLYPNLFYGLSSEANREGGACF